VVQWPVLLKMEGGDLVVHEACAPPLVLRWLLIGLVVVLALVIPALVWLYRVFAQPSERKS